MWMEKFLTLRLALAVSGCLALAACQAGSASPGADPAPSPSVAEAAGPAQGSTVIPTPTTEPQPAPTPEPLEGMARLLAEAGLDVDPDPLRSSLFNYNTLAYELPGMDQVEVVNLTYAFHQELPLTMDVYYPPGTSADDRLPVVIFGLGFRMSRLPLRNAHFYTSWGKLVAAAGMVGIAYDTEQPDADLETLVAFIRDHAAALRLDADRIGFLSSSANPPTVMSYLMQEGRAGIRFSVYYYGHSLTPDRKYTAEFDLLCSVRGCLAGELADVTYVDPEVALFIVKLGRDHVVVSNEAMDHFLAYVRGQGAQVTLVEYEDGRHGFDSEQKTEESAAIIAETLEFMRDNFGLE